MSTTYARLEGRLLILGFGSIGQGVLPLILRHIALDPRKITIVTADDAGADIAAIYGIAFHLRPLTPQNYESILKEFIGDRGDFLLNLSVNVSSTALINFCQPRGVLYLDTCIEPWEGGYTDPTLTPSQRSNYALRETALGLRERGHETTAVVAHGANPGLVSHFVKQALLNVAKENGLNPRLPTCRQGWAAMAQALNIKAIHIAERDTQVADHHPKAVGEFVNTWSIDGFVGEGCQPAELGWGTHEKALPPQGSRHEFGSDAAIYLNRPGAGTRVRSWTPLEGPYHGFLITHNEAISIADYLSLRDGTRVIYRPTVHYAYHPCDDAVLSLHEFAGKQWQLQPRKRLLMNEISRGMDELGVLLMGNDKGVYWYGSRLSVDAARALAPHNNATSLQVTAAVLAGMTWAINYPREGVVEADQLDFAQMLSLMAPYLGEVVGVWGDWSPLQRRNQPFPETLDAQDPWQFRNILVD